jgi:hypothetical protein
MLAVGLSAGCGGLLSKALANDNPTPAEVSREMHEAVLAGSARMRYFGFTVCDARLWVHPRFQLANYWQHPLALELAYQRNLKGPAIAQRSLDEMRRNGPIAPETASAWLATMTDIFPNVGPGDRITGIHMVGTGARFWLNGQLRSTVPDPEFSRLFFGIWLSDRTSEPKLRAELLAGLQP